MNLGKNWQMNYDINVKRSLNRSLNRTHIQFLWVYKDGNMEGRGYIWMRKLVDIKNEEES